MPSPQLLRFLCYAGRCRKHAFTSVSHRHTQCLSSAWSGTRQGGGDKCLSPAALRSSYLHAD